MSVNQINKAKRDLQVQDAEIYIQRMDLATRQMPAETREAWLKVKTEFSRMTKERKILWKSVDAARRQKEEHRKIVGESDSGVAELIKAVSDGSCPGIGCAKSYQLAQLAREMGLL